MTACTTGTVWGRSRPHGVDSVDAQLVERIEGDRLPWHTREVESGDRMLIWCEGGPSIGRAVTYPPPREIDAGNGMYVLVDDGPPEHWHYAFVPHDHTSR